jgi:hypothetical protein
MAEHDYGKAARALVELLERGASLGLFEDGKWLPDLIREASCVPVFRDALAEDEKALREFWRLERGCEPPEDADVTKIDHGFVYVLRSENNLFKIGKTNNLDVRANTLSVVVPVEVELIHYIRTDAAGWLERAYHQRFAHKRVKGEWFRLGFWDLLYVCQRDKLFFFPRCDQEPYELHRRLLKALRDTAAAIGEGSE